MLPERMMTYRTKSRLVGLAILLLNLALIGRYEIRGWVSFLMTFGFAFVWESFVVRKGKAG